ncbi:MAG: hypothetical protein H7Y27_14775 [Gemmatimonadaceae bacterium]|nr:hypothetical protein [Chitinophagaceae bacterium]
MSKFLYYLGLILTLILILFVLAGFISMAISSLAPQSGHPLTHSANYSIALPA